MRASDLKEYLETTMERFGDHDVVIGTVAYVKGQETLKCIGFSIAAIGVSRDSIRSVISDLGTLQELPPPQSKLKLLGVTE